MFQFPPQWQENATRHPFSVHIKKENIFGLFPPIQYLHLFEARVSQAPALSFVRDERHIRWALGIYPSWLLIVLNFEFLAWLMTLMMLFPWVAPYQILSLLKKHFLNPLDGTTALILDEMLLFCLKNIFQ